MSHSCDISSSASWCSTGEEHSRASGRLDDCKFYAGARFKILSFITKKYITEIYNICLCDSSRVQNSLFIKLIPKLFYIYFTVLLVTVRNCRLVSVVS
jgi:hypothetical protein